MGRSLSHRLALTRELREAVVRLCGGLGVLAGMWWMLSTPVPVRACTETLAERTNSTIITGCARQVILDSALHYGLAIAGGALIGGLVGLLLAALIPRPAGHRPARSRGVRAPATSADSFAVLSAAGSSVGGEHWITARYAGRCARARGPWRQVTACATGPAG